MAIILQRENLPGFDCADCGVNTHAIQEYYMVTFELWDVYGAGNGMLCIGCLEQRMTRLLDARDFLDCPLNWESWGKSERLRNRLQNET